MIGISRGLPWLAKIYGIIGSWRNPTVMDEIRLVHPAMGPAIFFAAVSPDGASGAVGAQVITFTAVPANTARYVVGCSLRLLIASPVTPPTLQIAIRPPGGTHANDVVIASSPTTVSAIDKALSVIRPFIIPANWSLIGYADLIDAAAQLDLRYGFVDIDCGDQLPAI